MATKSTKVGKGSLKTTSGRGIGKPVAVKFSATQVKTPLTEAKSISGRGTESAAGKDSKFTKGKETLTAISAKSISGRGTESAAGKDSKPIKGKEALTAISAKSVSGRGLASLNDTPKGKATTVKLDSTVLNKSKG